MGVVPYSHKISGKIIMAQPIDSCEPFRINNSNKEDFMILVLRNKCPIKTWAIFAEMVGAKAILVINNTD